MKRRILIIEDDLHIAEGLQLNFSLLDYDVSVADNGDTGLRLWKKWNPHIIILDIMLPGIDGLEVLEKIRHEDNQLPVLILSAKATIDDKIKGLSRGVDDYLTKPFNLEELMLRVERLLTRAIWNKKNDSHPDDDKVTEKTVYRFGINTIDFTKATAQCGKGQINLTEQEVKLLQLFIAHEGQPLSRQILLEIGCGYSSEASSRTIDNFIVRFRKYFEKDPRKPKYFRSRRSIGYLFDSGDDSQGK